MLLLNQLRKQKDAIEDICMEHSHVRMRNLDNWRSGEKEIGSFRNVVLQKNGWIELQMKKFLEESEKEEPRGRV